MTTPQPEGELQLSQEFLEIAACPAWPICHWALDTMPPRTTNSPPGITR